MRAGPLRHRITVEEPTQTRDAYGGFDQSWATFCTCWAQVMPLGGREVFSQQQVSTEASHKIRMRYRASAPTTDMRVSYGGKVFDIESVAETMNGHRELILMCKEREGDGSRTDGH